VNISNAFRPADGKDPFINIRQYNCKLASIIEMMIDPSRLKEKIFIYNDSVTGCGGAISDALILQLWKFRWVKNPESIKENPVRENNYGSFVLITSEDQTINTPNQIIKTLELFSADNNIYGDTLRLIIGSEAVSQGYTMKAVRQCHVKEGHWNMSALDQAMGRVFRVGSHDQLPEKERYINIYRHIAVNKGTDWSLLNQNKLLTDKNNKLKNVFSPDKTVDTIIYSIAEKKEYQSFQIYRIMEKSSWDCALNYKRNVLINDVDGSRECDFQECNYVCDGFTEENGLGEGEYFLKKEQGRMYSYNLRNDPNYPVSTSNYNLLYSEAKVVKYMDDIINLFHNYFSLKYEMLVRLLNENDIREFVLMEALNNLINYRISIRDRYGFKSYLNEKNNVYFLDKYIVPYPDYQNSVYEIFPLINEISSLQNSIEIIQLQGDTLLVKEFVKNPTLQNFNKLSQNTKIVLLESVITQEYSEIPLKNTEMKVTAIIFSALKDDFFIMSDKNVVHNMYNSEYTGVEYETSKKLEQNGKLRVFNINSKKWNYVGVDNEKKYIAEIKTFLTQLKKNKPVLADNPYKIRGAYNNKGKFKIIDDRLGKARVGKVCVEGGTKIEYIVELFHHLKHLPFDNETKNVNYTKPEIINLLKDNKKINLSSYLDELKDMPLSDLKKLWTITEMDKKGLCASIERFLKGENPEGLDLVEV
jgi:hypothetical protein